MADGSVNQYGQLRSLIKQYGHKNKRFSVAQQPIMVEASGGDFSYIERGSRVSLDGSSSRVRLVTWQGKDTMPTLDDYSLQARQLQCDHYALPPGGEKALLHRTLVDMKSLALTQQSMSVALPKACPFVGTIRGRTVSPIAYALSRGIGIALFAASFVLVGKLPALAATTAVVVGSMAALPVFCGTLVAHGAGVKEAIKLGGQIVLTTLAVGAATAFLHHPILRAATQAVASLAPLACFLVQARFQEWSPYGGTVMQPDIAKETSTCMQQAIHRALYTRLDAVVQRGTADGAFGTLATPEARAELEKASLSRLVLGETPHQAVDKSFRELTQPIAEPRRGEMIRSPGEFSINGVRVPIKA